MAAQVQSSGGTSGEGGEVESNNAPSLSDWLQANNLGDVSQHIESRFQQLNCQLEELLTFSKQDLMEFAKEDLKLQSPLKRNRFVNAILRLQSVNQATNKNTNTIVLTEKERQTLTIFNQKLYVNLSLLITLKSMQNMYTF